MLWNPYWIPDIWEEICVDDWMQLENLQVDKSLGILILVSHDVDDDGSRDHCDIIGSIGGLLG